MHVQGKKKKRRKRKNLETDLTPFTKINSKLITDLIVKCKTPRLQMVLNLDDPGFGNDFLDNILKT